MCYTLQYIGMKSYFIITSSKVDMNFQFPSLFVVLWVTCTVCSYHHHVFAFNLSLCFIFYSVYFASLFSAILNVGRQNFHQFVHKENCMKSNLDYVHCIFVLSLMRWFSRGRQQQNCDLDIVWTVWMSSHEEMQFYCFSYTCKTFSVVLCAHR